MTSSRSVSRVASSRKFYIETWFETVRGSSASGTRRAENFLSGWLDEANTACHFAKVKCVNSNATAAFETSRSSANPFIKVRRVVIRTMVVTSRPSTTDAAAVAAVLADIDMSSIGPDEGNATVVTDCDDNSSSNPQTNNDDDWRNEVDDKSIRRQIIMHM